MQVGQGSSEFLISIVGAAAGVAGVAVAIAQLLYTRSKGQSSFLSGAQRYAIREHDQWDRDKVPNWVQEIANTTEAITFQIFVTILLTLSAYICFAFLPDSHVHFIAWLVFGPLSIAFVAYTVILGSLMFVDFPYGWWSRIRRYPRLSITLIVSINFSFIFFTLSLYFAATF